MVFVLEVQNATSWVWLQPVEPRMGSGTQELLNEQAGAELQTVAAGAQVCSPLACLQPQCSLAS